ncbi:MAG TPA: cell division protein ZapB [Sediminispirochaeta sp.]|nr:cell division protein ZapB [Sediminispirochaeta sp.]
MVSVEQIRLLEKKVRGAVEQISSLKKENQSLKERLGEYEGRINELQLLIESFKQDQGEIEQGILSALDELNRLEDNLDSSEQDQSAEDTVNEDSVAIEAEETAPPVEHEEEDESPDSPQSQESSSNVEDDKTGELDIF